MHKQGSEPCPGLTPSSVSAAAAKSVGVRGRAVIVGTALPCMPSASPSSSSSCAGSTGQPNSGRILILTYLDTCSTMKRKHRNTRTIKQHRELSAVITNLISGFSLVHALLSSWSTSLHLAQCSRSLSPVSLGADLWLGLL